MELNHLYTGYYRIFTLLRIEYLKFSTLYDATAKILTKKNPEISFRIYITNLYLVLFCRIRYWSYSCQLLID